jgi:sulfite exporter TauE/SafE
VECCHPGIIPAASLAVLFTTGLLISLGHCLGMCGPLVSAYALAQRGEGSGRWAGALAAGRYHLGRLTCYVLLGGVLGLVGALIGGPERARVLTGVVSGVAGLAMVVGGLSLLGLMPPLVRLERLPVGGALLRRVRPLLASRSPWAQLGLGFANGLLPCGPLWAVALAAAASGGAWQGMQAMGAFGLGTVPALVVLAFGAGLLSVAVRRRFFRAGAVLVMVVGVQLLLRGLHAFSLVGPGRVGELVLW